MTIESVVERRDGGQLRAVNASSGASVEIDLRRGRLRIDRHDGATRAWWSEGHGGRATVELVRGRVIRRSPRAHRPDRRVGYGKLSLIPDREPGRDLTIVEPDSAAA